MSIVKPILRSILSQLLEHLDEDQRMHFKKIHKPMDDLSKSDLIGAIQLVERTLTSSGVEIVYMPPTIENKENAMGIL